MKCIRCKNEFKPNQMIDNDNVCNFCEQLNCITFWYPRLYRLQFPMPKTIIIHTNLPLETLADGVIPERVQLFIGQIREAIALVGTPAFLRTGHLSNKHDWERSCFIDLETAKDRNKLLSHIANIVEMSCVATIDRIMPIDFWAVREFIETKPYFKYFGGNMPITKERRFFVRDGKIECHHNYWDRIAFKNDIDEKKFEDMAQLSKEDEATLVSMALYVSRLFSGYWSLDFLKGKNNNWYLTDMAIGERSYHQKHPMTNKESLK